MSLHKKYKGVSRWVWLVWLAVLLAAGVCLAMAFFLATPPAPSHHPAASHPSVTHSAVPAVLPPLPQAEPSPTEADALGTLIAEEAKATPPAGVTEYPATPEPVPAPLPAKLQKKAGKLAIVIDDMGGEEDTSQAILDVTPPAVTLSFFPFGKATQTLLEPAHAAGHTIMLHSPMQPLGKAPYEDVGRLYVGDTSATITEGLTKQIEALQPYVVGANNHMGSAFTQWQPGMELALQQFDKARLFFLDSLTIRPTATQAAAKAVHFGQPLLQRDVFLDHDPTESTIEKQLMQAVHVAQTRGRAIAIGHPLSPTIAVLQRLLPTLTSTTGVTLVPITALLPKN